jgi:hypothetical protein
VCCTGTYASFCAYLPSVYAQVDVEGSDIYVTADVDEVKKNFRITKAPPGSKAEGKGVVIIGGGSGGLYAVEGLREVRLWNCKC